MINQKIRMKNKFSFSQNFSIFNIPSAIILLAIVFSGCTTPSKYPGYTEVENGIFYKLHIPGENGKKAGAEDYYEVSMLNKYGGKTFYDSEFENARGTLFMQSSSSRYFSVLGEGDSATFLLPGGDLSLPGMPDSGMVEMNVKIVRILSSDDFMKIQNTSDPDLDEQVLIQRYISKNKLTAQKDTTGLYFIPEIAGTGAKPEGGKTLKVKYSGMLFNNHIFDSNGPDGAPPFAFIWGQEGQMIPGIVNALSHMKAGGKAKIILPSPLAFGANGSSTGIVPPHTPVIYEVELISVE
jgi:FKBP-type peptidyl-prolyl cis-trans isomerase FkpA